MSFLQVEVFLNFLPQSATVSDLPPKKSEICYHSYIDNPNIAKIVDAIFYL